MPRRWKQRRLSPLTPGVWPKSAAVGQLSRWPRTSGASRAVIEAVFLGSQGATRIRKGFFMRSLMKRVTVVLVLVSSAFSQLAGGAEKNAQRLKIELRASTSRV